MRDFSEFLADLYRDHGGPRAVRHELKATTAYHDACHLAHAQRIRQQPRDLLGGIPGLDRIEVGGGGACCGSAGIYNLVQPEAAAELGQRKAAAIRATGARLGTTRQSTPRACAKRSRSTNSSSATRSQPTSASRRKPLSRARRRNFGKASD